MRQRPFRVSMLWVLLLLGASGRVWSQSPVLGPAPTMEANKLRQIWHVIGKVTDLKGQAIRGASVRVDPGMGARFVRELTTDVQGLFKTDYDMDLTTEPSFSVNILVEHEGFHPARQFVDFGVGDKTWEIDVMLRPDSDSGDDELSVDSLVSTLAPALEASLEKGVAIPAARKDFERGAQAFLDDHQPAKAVPALGNVVKRYPDCAHCRTLLGLAMLQAGDWNGATRQFVEADKLMPSKESGGPDEVNSLLIAAELENWKGDYGTAAGFMVKAKDLDPKNAFLLQELGRTLVLQKNWEAADEYLGEALRAGASREALLLRTRALLEEGDPEAAADALQEYMGAANLRNFPVSVRRLHAEIQTRLKLEAYGRVESVVSQPLPSLMQAAPELQGLQPAASQDDLASILQKTGEGVKAFFDSFQNTASVEHIREERLAKDGKIADALDQKFQYLLLTRPEKWGLGLEELRTNSSGERTGLTGLDSGLMLTSGFASASLLFHPEYQAGATFRYLGSQSLNGHKCHVVAFAQVPAKAQMVERFNTEGGSVLVLFQGLAWIDAGNFKIVRLRTDLLKPQTRIRLQRQTTEISYDPVQFKQIAFALWLPSEVAVTLQWSGRTYHNTHKYSDFRLFNTQTQEKVHELPDTATEQQ
jgi:tetratricopeptide (TPR) repeat protein